PRGGYELARERRRITAGDIVRAAMSVTGEEGLTPLPESRLVDQVVAPLVAGATDAFLAALDRVSLEELCRQADERRAFGGVSADADFTI
ncbi:MAG: Rrf2 family transcriptional regulator, partial [Microvirga sp.]